MMRLIPIVVLAAGLVASPSSAQQVRSTIQTDSLSIGGRTTLDLIIRHDGTRRAVFPDETEQTNPRLGDIELLERVSAGFRTTPLGERIDSVRYLVTTFALDTARVAPRVALATETDTISVAGLEGDMPVRSVVPEDASDIRDLAPLAEFPRAWWPWLLALLVLGGLFAAWLRRRGTIELPTSEPPPIPPEPPLDEALRRLAALSGAPPGGREDVKPFYVELSDILRNYVARRTRTPALELTTGELLELLPGRLDADRIRDVGTLLSSADLVKFADMVPSAGQSIQALSETREVVERIEERYAPVHAGDGTATAEPEVMV